MIALRASILLRDLRAFVVKFLFSPQSKLLSQPDALQFACGAFRDFGHE
jgi:hypothetical protein